MNRGAQKRNSSGYKGVYKKGNKFQSQIMAKGVSYHLGTYQTAEEAHKAYCQKAYELHDQFARFE